jgi:hypothetical protein
MSEKAMRKRIYERLIGLKILTGPANIAAEIAAEYVCYNGDKPDVAATAATAALKKLDPALNEAHIVAQIVEAIDADDVCDAPSAKRARVIPPPRFAAVLKDTPLHVKASHNTKFTKKETEALDAIGIGYSEHIKDHQTIINFVADGKLCKGKLDKDYVSTSLSKNKIHFFAISEGTQTQLHAIAILKDMDDSPFIEIDVLCSMSDSIFKNSAATLVHSIAMFAQELGKGETDEKKKKKYITLLATPGAKSYYEEKLKFMQSGLSIGLIPMVAKVSDILSGAENINYNTNDAEAIGADPYYMSSSRMSRKSAKVEELKEQLRKAEEAAKRAEIRHAFHKAYRSRHTFEIGRGISNAKAKHFATLAAKRAQLEAMTRLGMAPPRVGSTTRSSAAAHTRSRPAPSRKTRRIARK